MLAAPAFALYVAAGVEQDCGTRLRDLIAASGMPQRKVAEMLGVSPQSVTNWVGNRSKPTYDKLVELEKLLRVEPPGSLLRVCGYPMPGNTERPVSIYDVIRNHPDLPPEDKRALLTVVQRFLPDEA